MAGLLKQLRQWIMHKRLNYLESNKGESEWKRSTALLREIFILTDTGLLKHYSPSIGSSIPVATAFQNAEHLIAWLETFTRLVKEGDYLDKADLFPIGDGYMRSLHLFLVDNNDASVDAQQFCIAFRKLIDDLHSAISEVHDPLMGTYYTRKLNSALADLFAVQEGLLYVALNV